MLESHPAAVYLREDPVRDAVNGWIGQLFNQVNVDGTVAALVASQNSPEIARPRRGTGKKRLADLEARLQRFQEAIASGIDPVALVDVINEAQRERAAARAELEGAPAPNLLTDAEASAMVDSRESQLSAGRTCPVRAVRTPYGFSLGARPRRVPLPSRLHKHPSQAAGPAQENLRS